MQNDLCVAESPLVSRITSQTKFSLRAILCTYNFEQFKFSNSVDRFYISAQTLDLEPEEWVANFLDQLNQLVEQNSFPSLRDAIDFAKKCTELHESDVMLRY